VLDGEEKKKIMTPESALQFLHMQLEQYLRERETTRKVLAALPDSGADYKPDPKSRPAFDLAFHIANSDKGFLEFIVTGSYSDKEDRAEAGVTKPSELAAWYMKVTDAALEKVRAMTGEDAAKILDFYGAFQMPAAAYMTFMLTHGIHHRGQLSVYLRPAGGLVPSIYGGSADEPWQPGA
jgi:uncharacterized damage-inducible protein DinB